jgi:hypothetical protein
MFMRRVLKFAMASESGKVTKLPKAPTLLSGELENFRFDAEHQRIFDGYSLDELYGSKIGIKHSPAVQAEMRKYRQLYPETPLPQSCFSSSDSASSGTFIASTRFSWRNSSSSMMRDGRDQSPFRRASRIRSRNPTLFAMKLICCES